MSKNCSLCNVSLEGKEDTMTLELAEALMDNEYLSTSEMKIASLNWKLGKLVCFACDAQFCRGCFTQQFKKSQHKLDCFCHTYRGSVLDLIIRTCDFCIGSHECK